MRPPLRRLPSLLVRGLRRHLPPRPNLLPRRRPQYPSSPLPGASFSAAAAVPSPTSAASSSSPAATVAVSLRTRIAAVFAKHPCRIPNSFVSCIKSQNKRYPGIRVSPRVLARPPVVCVPRRGMAALSSLVGDCSTSGCAPRSIEDDRDDDDLDSEDWDGNNDAGGRGPNSGRSDDKATDSFIDSFGQRKKARLVEENNKKRRRYGGEAQGNQPPFDGSQDDPMPLPNPMVGFNLPSDRLRSVKRRLSEQAVGPPFFYYENVALAPRGVWRTISRTLYDIEPEFVDSKYLCAAARKRGYIHNLPIDNRSPLLPLPPKNIFEAFPDYEKWWPSWDPRRQLNCLLTSVASAKLTERIEYALASSGSLPSPSVQKYVTDECRKWNLVWIGKNKVAPLEPHEMEYLLGFPRDHTRGVCKMERYKALGNSFQVDTVAYHLSVLRDMFPDGINVLSLFTGIGGGEVALHKLGVHMKTVVSVEISEVNRRIFRGWWNQNQTGGSLIEIPDVETLTNDTIESLTRRLGGFDLIIGGSPCNNLTGSNRHHRDGLQGEQSALFYEYSRILNVVKSVMARM
ncbi:hypothetical protein ACQJBY_037989 [Aegilops geniculata]